MNNKNKKFLDNIKKIPKEKLKIMIETALGKKSLYEFFKLCMLNYYKQFTFHDNWHYDVVCCELQNEYDRFAKKLKTEKHILINLPFRSGKSILISEIFPVWLWVQDQSLEIQTISSTQNLAQKSSAASRNLLSSDWFKERWDIQLRSDTNAKGNFSTIKNGNRKSFGINSSIIGSGFDIQILDDANDPRDSYSITKIINVINVFKDVLVGRANNECAFRICIQQRTSENDICGYLLENNFERYKHICIPAILSSLTTEKYKKYYINGLFFPKLFPQSRLDNLKNELNLKAYASQLLQAPSALEGDLLKKEWFKIIKKSDYLKISLNAENYLILDTAYTNNQEKNDPTAFLICSRINNLLYISRVEEKWLEFPELIAAVKDCISAYNIKEILIESKSSGLSLIQTLKAQTKYISIRDVSPNGNKEERARAITLYLQHNKVILVEDNWNNLFLNQIAAFPYANHDDIVDCLIYATNKYIIGDYSASKLK